MGYGIGGQVCSAALLHRFDKAKGATPAVKCDLKLVLF
jgi:hypothetical protein